MEKRNIEIVKTISLLAERLGLQTVAEGVETKEQHQWLKSIHCRQGQGYLFAKPLVPDAAKQFISNQRMTSYLPSQPVREAELSI